MVTKNIIVGYIKKNVINNYKKAKINKIKEEKKQAKQKEKEEMQNAKNEAKQKAKDEKQKAKEEAKKSSSKKTKMATIMPVDETSENIIIGVSSVAVAVSVAEAVAAPILLCQEILQSGKNKGTHCGNKIFENNVCKRHANKPKIVSITNS